MAWVASETNRYLGKVVDNGQCVRLCQIAAPGLPHTSQWRPGVPAYAAEPGTVIATFNAAGRYANATDGSSHAAIFLRSDAAGLHVVDQWVGQPAHERVIRHNHGVGLPCNDAGQFFVVE